ncbi:TrmH family RNA methyltransferase [Occultella gossypii]|uniref:NshR/TsnR family 23S rRNA methyltransferase n=1 Tax=Occultella gossypii TaxID=2800820 RepID=A0ABS7S977_9MICO|nr:TrmH family RNA methyltransferase [Occultella gossypii]MBZ2196892.1 NshR/TsnR family 23S rRNA methyltransferase [Occultella gossypii]
MISLSSPVTDSLTVDSVIESSADSGARRVRDVLRAGARARNTILIDDEENIVQALRNGIRLNGIYVTNDPPALSDEVRAAAWSDRIPIHRLARAVADELFAGEKRTRVFALATHPHPYTLDDVARRAGDIVVLDGVRLTGNVGAITRTAAALGGAGIALIGSGLTSVFDRRLIRSSRGLVFTLPVALACRGEMHRFLRDASATLVSLAPDGTTPLSELASFSGRVALLLGGERTGASPGLDSLARHRYAVAMRPSVESLNVSVAGALALYERHRAPL